MWSTNHACCWISRRCARTARWMGVARPGDVTPPSRGKHTSDPAPTRAPMGEEPTAERPMRPLISFWPAIREEE